MARSANRGGEGGKSTSGETGAVSEEKAGGGDEVSEILIAAGEDDAVEDSKGESGGKGNAMAGDDIGGGDSGGWNIGW